jgi:hypothetical protein
VESLRELIRKALETPSKDFEGCIPESLDPSILADEIKYTPEGVIYYHMGREIGRGPLPNIFRR